MRRYTTVRIAIFSMILQSALSLVSFASFVRAYRHASASLYAAYPVAQRWLWLIALLWSLVTLISGLALLRGRGWGRVSYACAACLALLAYFIVAPWPLALCAVPVAAATTAVLFSRAGTHYLRDDAARHNAASGWRARFATLCFVLSSTLLYLTHLTMCTTAGWIVRVLPGCPAWTTLIASAVLIAVGALLSQKGSRVWRSGVALMVFVVVDAFALLGYLPYAPALARYLGPAYRPYDMLWGVAIALTSIIGALALTMLQMSRVPRPRAPLTMPDYL